MSRLLALDVETIKDYRDVQLLFSHIGQSKDYFLAQIPKNLENQLIESFKKFSEIDRIRAIELLKKIKENFGIIRCSDNNKIKSFKQKVLTYYQEDKRLELAVTDQNQPPPFKTIDELSYQEWLGPKTLEISPSGPQYTEAEFNRIWDHLEFFLITTSKLSLLGRYNFIFDPKTKKPTNLYYLLKNIFKKFKIRGCRCELLKIYSSPNSKNGELESIYAQKNEIKEFLNELNSIYKIRFGIQYYVLEDKRDEFHQRFLITSHTLISMGDEFTTSKNRSLISVITDPNAVKNYQSKWLEDGYENLNPFVQN